MCTTILTEQTEMWYIDLYSLMLLAHKCRLRHSLNSMYASYYKVIIQLKSKLLFRKEKDVWDPQFVFCEFTLFNLSVSPTDKFGLNIKIQES